MRRLAPGFQLLPGSNGLDAILFFQTRSNTMQDQRVRKKTIQHERESGPKYFENNFTFRATFLGVRAFKYLRVTPHHPRENSEKPQLGRVAALPNPGGCLSCRVWKNLPIFLLCSKSMRNLHSYRVVLGTQTVNEAFPGPPVMT